MGLGYQMAEEGVSLSGLEASALGAPIVSLGACHQRTRCFQDRRKVCWATQQRKCTKGGERAATTTASLVEYISDLCFTCFFCFQEEDVGETPLDML